MTNLKPNPMKTALAFSLFGLITASTASALPLYQIADLGQINPAGFIIPEHTLHIDEDNKVYGTLGIAPFSTQISPFPTQSNLDFHVQDFNSHNQIIGYQGSFPFSQATLSEPTNPSLEKLLPGSLGMGRGINEAGQVTGLFSMLDSQGKHVIHGFVGDKTNLVDIGTFVGGDISAGLDINNNGTITGFANGGGTNRNPQAFIGDINGLTPIGTLAGGQTSWGLGINDANQVVGVSNTADSQGHAFLYDFESDLMFDLNNRVTNMGSWQELQSAEDINNQGNIVGYGLNQQGITHAFLLTQVPEPASITLLSLGLLGLSASKRRLKK